MIRTQAAPDALPGTLVPSTATRAPDSTGAPEPSRPSGCWSPTVRRWFAPAFARCWRPTARSASSARRRRAEEAVALARSLRPDVVLIDATLPWMRLRRGHRPDAGRPGRRGDAADRR